MRTRVLDCFNFFVLCGIVVEGKSTSGNTHTRTFIMRFALNINYSGYFLSLRFWLTPVFPAMTFLWSHCWVMKNKTYMMDEHNITKQKKLFLILFRSYSNTKLRVREVDQWLSPRTVIDKMSKLFRRFPRTNSSECLWLGAGKLPITSLILAFSSSFFYLRSLIKVILRVENEQCHSKLKISTRRVYYPYKQMSCSHCLEVVIVSFAKTCHTLAILHLIAYFPLLLCVLLCCYDFFFFFFLVLLFLGKDDWTTSLERKHCDGRQLCEPDF